MDVAACSTAEARAVDWTVTTDSTDSSSAHPPPCTNTDPPPQTHGTHMDTLPPKFQTVLPTHYMHGHGGKDTEGPISCEGSWLPMVTLVETLLVLHQQSLD